LSDDGQIKTVLWDIDGTLLVTGGAGAVAWQRAFEERWGVEANIEEHTQPGMTETSLVPELAVHAGLTFDELVRWMVDDASLNR